MVFDDVTLSMNGLRKGTQTKNKILQQGIGIAEKAKKQEGIAGVVM